MPSPTPGTRCTFFLSDGGATWTESFYLTSITSYDQVLNQTTFLPIPAFGNIIQARFALCFYPSQIVAVRLSVISQPRSSQYVSTDYLPVNTPIPANEQGEDSSDVNWTVIQLNWKGDAGGVKKTFVSGAPDVSIGSGTPYKRNISNNTSFFTALGNFQVAMIGMNAAFRTVQYTNSQPVDHIDANGPAGAPVQLLLKNQLTGLSATPPFNISLKGFRRINTKAPGLKPSYALFGTPPTAPNSAGFWAYPLAKANPALVPNMGTMGIVAPLSFLYQFMSNAVPVRATHRKRGVSALAAHGRSKTRA